MGPIGDAARREAFFDGYRKAQRTVLHWYDAGEDAARILLELNDVLATADELPVCECGDMPGPHRPSMHPADWYLCAACRHADLKPEGLSMPKRIHIAFESVSHKPDFTILGLFQSHAAAVARCQQYAKVAGVAVPYEKFEHQTLFKIEEWPVSNA